METISFYTIIIFIVFVIVIIMYIASVNYQSEINDKSKTNKKNLEVKNDRKLVSKLSSKKVLINSITPEIEYNCYTFSINNINEKNAYIISGNFNNTYLTLYDKDKPLFSKEFDGESNLVFMSNTNLSSVCNINKNKSYFIPLKLNESYKVVFNNVINPKVQNISINYDIQNKPYKFEYPGMSVYSEYDLEYFARKNIPYISERVYPKIFNRNNIWKFSDKGRYVVIYVKNTHNFDININSNNIPIRKNDNQTDIEYEYTDNPHIIIKNLDYIDTKKSMNNDYIDFITSPNILFDKFFNGDKIKNIHFVNRINDKILIYKI